MKKLLNSKYWWLSWLILLLVVNYLTSVYHFRIDFTQENRYTLSNSTKRLLGSLDNTINIEVFLKGELKAGTRKLAESVDELLQDFKEYSNGKLQIRFIDPFTDYEDSVAKIMIDSLKRMGIQPMADREESVSGGEQSQRIIFPGAIVSTDENVYPINFFTGVENSEKATLYTNAEALLEYKFTFAISKLIQKKIPRLAYLIGNGEPIDYTSYTVRSFLAANYRTAPLNLEIEPFIPKEADAVVMIQPVSAFSDSEKLKLDQYIMNGGKLLVFLDVLDANMDSLRGRDETVAYNKGLNLDDLFFKYGIRINEDLALDMQSAIISPEVGKIGKMSQTAQFKWPYYPLLTSSRRHPISKNLDPVYSRFVNTIDTVKSNGIRKTVLLTTSKNGRSVSTPALITLESLKVADDPEVFNKPYLPVGMLLEGKFSSLYANRLSSATQDSLQKISGRPFLASGVSEAKIIVIADGDIALNEVGSQGPIRLGFNKDINYTFSNLDFLQNCVEYLTDSVGIMESRTKDITLRLLDAKKVEEERSLVQMTNIAVPIVLVILFGLIYHVLRKRKYQV